MTQEEKNKIKANAIEYLKAIAWRYGKNSMQYAEAQRDYKKLCEKFGL